jgi:hypothetical protein
VRYVAELGYYAAADGAWKRISTSAPTLTPPDSLSEDTSVHFATIPSDVTFEQLASVIKVAVTRHVPLAEAIMQLRAAGYADLPAPQAFAQSRWTPEQEKALAAVVSMDSVRRVWIGSLEITELVRRQLLGQISSAAAAQVGIPPGAVSGALGSVSSPFGVTERRKGFWFNVNAELIIYGATEPDARVTIGGRVIRLRRDGTFSYRFALPDGTYALPATATSADGTDQRTAALRFERGTTYTGDVAAHPQDPQLKPPHPAHVA